MYFPSSSSHPPRRPPRTSTMPAASARTTSSAAPQRGLLHVRGSGAAARHGAGKYLWTDRCMYEGEWRHGKATGRGKFSWPSGATYRASSRTFMDGDDTYTVAAGDPYNASWSMNLNDGDGRKSYAKGDQYDSDWRSRLQDGYIHLAQRDRVQGEWRAGLIDGRGAGRHRVHAAAEAAQQFG
nr:phosphatidylinositol 4-phosphate 5-kinase 6-like isoform X2 [Aegilops tauschii subsp. strangulata]